MAISNLADVSLKSDIASSVVIKSFATVEEDVVIGENTLIDRNSVIMKGSRIGSNCKIFPSTVIGAIPQDLKFKGEYTEVFIGNNTTIREFVTINRGTSESGKTIIGNNCLLMAYVHIAHDCEIGNDCVIANSVNIAGHVTLENWVTLEGLVAVQQFVRIGAHAFVAGYCATRKNVPPFVKAAREPLSYIGVNLVGLKRRGFDDQAIKNIEAIYKYIFIHNSNISKAVKVVEEDFPKSSYKSQIVEFILASEKGIIKGYDGTNFK